MSEAPLSQSKGRNPHPGASIGSSAGWPAIWDMLGLLVTFGKARRSTWQVYLHFVRGLVKKHFEIFFKNMFIKFLSRSMSVIFQKYKC